MEDPTHPGYVTERREATFEELRKLFPSVERAAQAAIEATVEHVRNGSCVPGAEAFLHSLGIEVPVTEQDIVIRATVPVSVNFRRTVEVNVLTAAQGGDDYSDPSDNIDSDAMREGARDAIGAGDWAIDSYSDVEVEESYFD